MIRSELDRVLRLHALWLNGEDEGVRADLSWEDLSGANLEDANLKDANLDGAILKDAILKDANLKDASLSCVILFRVNLTSANLKNANLSYANLSYANLSRANLSNANLSRANLTDAVLPDYQICPDGEFTSYKKVSGGVILELRIPADARRTNSLVGRKCRCDRAFVVRALNSDEKEFQSLWNSSFIYRVGEMVEEPGYSDDIREECLTGIHFFLTRKEAEAFIW